MSSYDVFLSHNSADKPTVREVAERLGGAGVTYFFDEEHLPPGKPWQEELEQTDPEGRQEEIESMRQRAAAIREKFKGWVVSQRVCGSGSRP